MSLIIVLLLAAVAWYLLSGLGNRQRVGGGGTGNRDFRVNKFTTGESSNSYQTGSTNQGGQNQNQNQNHNHNKNQNQGSSSQWSSSQQSQSNLIQPEDAQQKSGTPSVSSSGQAVTAQSSSQQSSSQGNQLQSSTYNYGEDSGTLASMQDQAGSSSMNWETPGLLSDTSTTGQGGTSNSLATGHGTNGATRLNTGNSLMTTGTTSGLTNEINNLYDGGHGTYEGTTLGSNTQSPDNYDYDYTTNRFGEGVGMTGGEIGGTTTTDLTETTAGTNSYQPQETGFSDATTTDENGQPETKVTSIENKRNKKRS